jgi:DNA primase
VSEEPNFAYIESVLNQYGLENVRKSGKGFSARCPFHNDRTASFSMTATGLWICGGCKAKGNIFTFHSKLGGGKLDWKESLKALGMQLDNSKYDKPKRAGKGTISLPADFTTYLNEEAVPPAIAKRLSWDTINHFCLGSSETFMNKGRCVIPIHFEGNMIGYHSRALSNDMEPRYYNPGGFDIKDNVFNYDSCAKRSEVIVVEGAFNAMSMWEKGFKNAIAVFGTMFTAKQLNKIYSLSPKSVVICFDRDPSKIKNGKEEGHQGQKATKKFGESFSELIPTYVMPLPMSKDPNDLDKESLHKCYDKRVTYDSIFRNKPV